MSSPKIISAPRLREQLEARGVRLSVQWVRERNGERWPRVWLSGPIRPGDFEAIGHVRTQMALLLSGDQYSEGRPVEGCDYALTRGFDPPVSCLIPPPEVEAAEPPPFRFFREYHWLPCRPYSRGSLWREE